ncbi:MAG: hypothetical protein RR232_04590 [Clostridia bacterium]
MKHNRRRIRRRRRRSLSASNWGPVLALSGTILGILALIALVLFVVLPRVMPLIGVEYNAPFMPTPTPSPTPKPLPTPNPMERLKPVDAQTEVVFSESGSYRWFADPYFYDGVMIFSAGNLSGQNAVLTDLYLYYPDSRTAEKLPYHPVNAHIMYARFNEQWIVYFDAKLNGGGQIMAVDRTKPNAQPVVIKDIYSGQPEIQLSGNYIAFIDRTGSRMDKLFVCDLNTLESTTVAMFSGSIYGQSLPSLKGDLLTWADSLDSASGSMTSAIYSIRLGSSTVSTYNPGTYAHDPESDGKRTAWLTDNHGPDTQLYYSIGGSAPILIDSGVIDYSLGENFIAYSKGDVIYAYSFETKTSYRISPEHQLAQFLGASDGKVIWMDVTSRDVGRDIIMFANIP